MSRHAAFLRGISPSGRNMTNDRLREVFRRVGLGHVSSVLSSGNLVFSCPTVDLSTLERRIEAALATDLGLTSTTIVRTASELEALRERDRFPGLVHGPDTYLTVTFLQDAAAAADATAGQPDPRTRVVGFDEGCRAVLAVTDTRSPGAAPMYASWLESTYGRRITMRSWLTVQRVVTALALPGG